jgi:hypothetical protein
MYFFQEKEEWAAERSRSETNVVSARPKQHQGRQWSLARKFNSLLADRCSGFIAHIFRHVFKDEPCLNITNCSPFFSLY